MKANKIIMALILLVAVFLPGQVIAQDAQQQGGGNGLSISPTRNELVIERGEAETVSIQVRNVSPVDINARMFLNDFEADGLTGGPRLIITEEERSSNSLRDFLVGTEDVFVPAGETARVSIFFQVPENAAPGAYYGALRFVPTNAANDISDEDSQVALTASVASLVLIEVPGDIVERIQVDEVAALLDDDAGSLFTKVPNEVGITISNLGNGFSKPFGKVSVTGPFGQGEIYTYELNDTSPRGNILPESARQFIDPLENVSRPGKYTITANISHGNGGEILSATATFWYIPMWIMLVMVVLLVVLVGLALYLYRKYATKSTKRRR